MRNIFYLVLISLFYTSCSKEDLFSNNTENRFFLENNSAIMPVQIKGNTNSKLFVITLHGGPGDSGIQGFSDNGVFRELEKDYAMVYFDQRCAGLSQGNCDPKTLNVSDFVEDIDKLVAVLENIYGEDLSLFLLGHSWGATLGLDYLINGANKHKIKGCIQSDGSHNIPKLFIEQKEILIFYANQQINLGNNTNKWQSILDEISDADPTIESDRGTILNNAYRTEELFSAVDSVTLSNLSYSIGSYFSSIFPVTVNEIINSDFTLSLFEYNITDQLDEILTPTALYWGRFDMVHPPNMANDIFSNLGTTEKELFFFSKTFHSPMINENDLYQDKVREFIELYR